MNELYSNIRIIHEDEDILVIYKPQGLIIHHGSGVDSDTLFDWLTERYKEQSEEFKEEFRMGIVHRLDKDTSGLMVIAKNKQSALSLIEEFKNHRVTKTYTALCYSFFNKYEGTIDAPIGRSTSNRKKFSVKKEGEGKEAISHYEVKDQFFFGKKNKNCIALVKVNIETGRTHQIRVHMSSIGHPVVGDHVYGKNKWQEGGELGLMLEATALSFEHPKTKKRVAFELPLATRFEKALAILN